MHLTVQSGPYKVVTKPAPGKDIGASNGAGKIVTLPARNNGKVVADHEIKTIDTVKHVDLPVKPRERVEATDSFKRASNAPARIGGGNFAPHFAMGGGGGFGGQGRR
jgi:hypothetical protein